MLASYGELNFNLLGFVIALTAAIFEPARLVIK